MRNDWSYVWTLQFLVGTLVVGLLLNVLGTYVVRALDSVKKRLPAYFRRVREEESVRIQTLSTAATSDSALHAALAAEAGRLRLHQLLGFFIAFVCIATLALLVTVRQLTLPESMTVADRVEVGLLITFLVFMGGFNYVSG
jgi:hypothetical protein